MELENTRYDNEKFETDLGWNYIFRGEWLNVTLDVNPFGFCDWQGVTCSIDNTEIESLSLPSNNLNGLLPAELAMLHRSLSEFIV